MTSEELSDAITDQIKSLESRILGVGRDQYDFGNKQKIEFKTIDQIFIDSIEEIDDLLIYLTYIRIRIQQLKKQVLESQSPLATD